MNIKLLGHRVLLKYEKLKKTSSGGVIFPDTVGGEFDLHCVGRVRTVGDGRVFDSRKRRIKQVPALVELDDLVMFQINDMMSGAQMFQYQGEKMIYLLQTELIARINGEQLNLTTFEILGDYILVKPELVQSKGDILLPDTYRSLNYTKYTAIQKGGTVDLPFNTGQELICKQGRVNSIFIPVPSPDGTTKLEEFGYVFKEFVLAVVENNALQA